MFGGFTVNDPFLGLELVVKGELKSVFGVGCWRILNTTLCTCLRLGGNTFEKLKQKIRRSTRCTCLRLGGGNC